MKTPTPVPIVGIVDEFAGLKRPKDAESRRALAEELLGFEVEDAWFSADNVLQVVRMPNMKPGAMLHRLARVVN